MSELESHCHRRVLRSGASAVHAGEPGPARGWQPGAVQEARGQQRLHPGLIWAGWGGEAAAGAAEPTAH